MLEKIYSDFTTQLLPKIAEGFTITKDYFFDLFGRYVWYLITIDILQIILLSVISTISFIVAKKIYKIHLNRKEEGFHSDEWLFATIFVSCIGIIMFWIACFEVVPNLTKAIFVPEIRVFQELQSYVNPTK